EHEQHLYRPASDAAHLREARDDLFVAELEEGCRLGHDRGDGLLREVPQRGDLGEGEAGAAQALDRSCQHLLRGGKYAGATGTHQPPEYGVGGDAIELLVSDGARERLKGMAVALRGKPARTDGADQLSEHRVGARKMVDDAT